MDEELKKVEIDSKSKELMESWEKEAERLKKKHPKWNKARIQEEMKKRIVKQAEAAIPTKSAKEYLAQVNAQLKEAEDSRNKAIDRIMKYMERTSPEAVATAIFELNCGCIRACAVSNEGAPMGEMIMVSGTSVETEYNCKVCENDGGADPERCINKAIIWPGEESEMPAAEFRLEIGKKVFGDDYSMDDI